MSTKTYGWYLATAPLGATNEGRDATKLALVVSNLAAITVQIYLSIITMQTSCPLNYKLSKKHHNERQYKQENRVVGKPFLNDS